VHNKTISIQNSLGGIISVSVHYPESITNKLAILLPGYLDSKDYPHLVSLAKDLSNVGYTAVRVDLTGMWESGSNIEDYTVTQHLKDIQNVVEYMLTENKYEHIVIGGHSRGGFLSILYAIKDSRISAVIGIMPPYALLARNVNKEKVKKWEEAGSRIYSLDVPGSNKEKKEVKVPYSNIEDTKKYNLLNEINMLHCPLLLIAGELDEVILPTDVEDIYKEANDPKKYIVLQGIGHNYRNYPEQIERVNKEIIEFLQNKL